MTLLFLKPVSVKDARSFYVIAEDKSKGGRRMLATKVLHGEANHLLHFSGGRIAESILRNTQRRACIPEFAFHGHSFEFVDLIQNYPIVCKATRAPLSILPFKIASAVSLDHKPFAWSKIVVTPASSDSRHVHDLSSGGIVVLLIDPLKIWGDSTFGGNLK